MRKPISVITSAVVWIIAAAGGSHAQSAPDLVSYSIGEGAPAAPAPPGASHYAAYYAPYAIQAVATYAIRTGAGNADGSNGRVLSGADVGFDRAILSGSGDYSYGDQAANAQKILSAWQYEFGHDGYLGCLADELPGEPSQPDDKCHKALQNVTWQPSGLAFDVWSLTNRSDACNEVSIAFRGTFARADWRSDLRSEWRDPTMDDQYVQLKRNVDTIINHIRNLDCSKRAGQKVQIVTVGHSLGGGLAQFAALAQALPPPKASRRFGRISKVFAFNPSPEIGIDLIDQTTWQQNRQGLTVDIIRQKGDGLGGIDGALTYYGTFAWLLPQSLRLGLSTQPLNPVIKPTTCNPVVRSVEFNVANPPSSWRFLHNAYELHGMALLASNLVRVSFDKDGDLMKQGQLPGSTVRGCLPDYIQEPYEPGPAKENNTPAMTSLGPQRSIYASAGAGGPVPQMDQSYRAFQAGPEFGRAANFYAAADYGGLPESARRSDSAPAPRRNFAATRPLYASARPHDDAGQVNQYGPIYPAMTDQVAPNAAPPTVKYRRIGAWLIGHRGGRVHTADL